MLNGKCSFCGEPVRLDSTGCIKCLSAKLEDHLNRGTAKLISDYEIIGSTRGERRVRLIRGAYNNKPIPVILYKGGFKLPSSDAYRTRLYQCTVCDKFIIYHKGKPPNKPINLCKSCTEAIIYDGIRTIKKSSLYVADNRIKAFMSAVEFLRPFIPRVPVNVITLPSDVTWYDDYLRLSNIVPFRNIIYWYDLPPKGLADAQRIGRIQSAAKRLMANGINVDLRFKDVFEDEDISNIAYANLDLCCNFKDSDVDRLVTLISRIAPLKGNLSMTINFSIRSTGGIKDYKSRFNRVISCLRKMNIEVIDMAHFTYRVSYPMFLTAIAVERSNTLI